MNATETARKNMLDINCLSTGSTLFIKIDNVTVMKNQFDTFLEKLMNNEKVKYDTKLPIFIIDGFLKLFKHWKKLPELQKMINRDMFLEVFKEMSKVFEPCPANGDSLPVNTKEHSAYPYFSIFCNDCKTRIKILNDDFQLSYDLHIQSEEHEKCSFKPEVSSALASTSGIKYTSKVDIASTSRTNVIFQNSYNDYKMSRSQASSSNRSRSASVQKEISFKVPSVDDSFCEPCCRTIAGPEGSIDAHVVSRSHLKQLELYRRSVELLKLNQSYISMTDRSSFHFFCRLCLKSQVGTNCFIQHCRSLEHRNNVSQVKSSAPDGKLPKLS